MHTGYHVCSQVLDSGCIAFIPCCGILVGLLHRPWHILHTQRTQVMLVQQCTYITALPSLAASPLLRVIRVILTLALTASHETNETAQIKILIIKKPHFYYYTTTNDKRALLLRREIESLN